MKFAKNWSFWSSIWSWAIKKDESLSPQCEQKDFHILNVEMNFWRPRDLELFSTTWKYWLLFFLSKNQILSHYGTRFCIACSLHLKRRQFCSISFGNMKIPTFLYRIKHSRRLSENWIFYQVSRIFLSGS